MLRQVDLEPAVRDPKKLRNTALVLVAIIVVGGCLVLKAYEVWAQKQSSDTRPAIVHRILKERDLRITRQDGKIVDLYELRGHVWVINVFDLKNPKPSERSLGVMKRLAEKYAANTDFNLVSLAVNPVPATEIDSALLKAAESNGMKLPQWWVGSNEYTTLHKFIKTELKASVFPHQAEGEWVFDAAIILVDKNGHIRRAVVPQKKGGQPYVATFDFDQAAAWDAKGVKTGTERSNEAEMETLLVKTIDTLLAEPAVKP
ncbi:MAG: hypothetical protein H8M99_02155 [Gloeobacteraceae cyanobacterium ES-bin-144]|nr:hypothetical protein [Verrucomicrobiales bacterium]